MNCQLCLQNNSFTFRRFTRTIMPSFVPFISAVATALLLGVVHGGVLFSTLPRSLVVQASPKPGDVLKAGKDKVSVTWAVNQTYSGSVAEGYKTIKVKLCYAPVSQAKRAWRKSNDELSEDKTCQFDIASVPLTSTDNLSLIEWVVGSDTPTATYFVRAYAMDSCGKQVGYGQSTNSNKTTNLFQIQGIHGRRLSIDIAVAAFSAFSVFSLFTFFLVEKKMAKKL